MMTPGANEVDLKVVGSSTFGIHPIISSERTYNMYESDGWLVNYAGYKLETLIDDVSTGRGIFHSVRGNFMLAIIGQGVFKIPPTLVPQFVGSLSSSKGQVYIDENLSGQICIVDGNAAYIYNDSLLSLTKQAIVISGFKPNYVTYHNLRFLLGNGDTSSNGAKWYVFEYATDTTITQVAVGGEQALENKPDSALAIVRTPGKGNHVMVFGSTVGASFTQVGGLLNYQRSSSFNLDYGVVSVATIATSDEIICWLAQNENNAPVIMISQGGPPQAISTDGINGLLGDIKSPELSFAYFYRQDGHLFYHLTFYGPEDNKSLVYDFTGTKGFYIATDENDNYYPIRQIVYFNNAIYGVSINDGGLYRIGSHLTEYDYGSYSRLIPRTRLTKAVRFPNSDKFRANLFRLWYEQGVDLEHNGVDEFDTCIGQLITETGGEDIVTEGGLLMLDEEGGCSSYDPHLGIRISSDGGQTYSNVVEHPLNTVGNFKGEVEFYRLGYMNDFRVRIDIWTRSRAVMGYGIVEVYK